MKKIFAITICIITTTFAAEIVVNKGDTLNSIANANCTTVQEILNLNPEIKNPNKIQIGQKIQIPDLDVDRLFSAFVYVESRGDDSAVGDNGKAVGPLQMWPIMVDECNRLADTAYTYEDRKDRSKCKEMFSLLMQHKGVKTVNQAIKVWNPRSNGNAYRKAYKERK